MCMDAQVPCSPWKDENGLSPPNCVHNLLNINDIIFLEENNS